MSALDGFTSYSIQRPPANNLCVFYEEYSRKRWTGYDDDFLVWGNRVCIWWQISGIERMKPATEWSRRS